MPSIDPQAPSRLMEEAYPLPCLEALFASTLAPMTGFAQSVAHRPHRPLLAAPLVSNLRMRWQALVQNASSPLERVQPTPLWHATPTTEP